jgi:hypothetical protein
MDKNRFQHFSLPLTMDTSGSSPPNSIIHPKDSSSLSSNSKKRLRDDHKADLRDGNLKKAKSALGAIDTSPVTSSLSSIDVKRSWEQLLFSILCQKMIMGGMIYITKCSHEKCSWPSYGANSIAVPLSKDMNLVELESMISGQCERSVLEHSFVWCDDVEPRKGDGIVIRVQRLFSMTTCARWMATHWNSIHNTFEWVYLMVTRIQTEIESLKTVLKEKANMKKSPALETLLSSLSDSSSTHLTKISIALKISSKLSPDTSLSDSSVDTLQTRINAIATLDNLYYLLYHYSLVSPLSSVENSSSSKPSSQSKPLKSEKSSLAATKAKTKKSLSISPPAQYLKMFFDPVSEELCEMLSIFWKQEVDRVTRKRVQKTIENLESVLASISTNPLLAIWHLKFTEYVRFYYITGLSKKSKEMENAIISVSLSSKPAKKQSNLKRVKQMQLSKDNASEPISSEGIQSWRDASRDWPSLIYAYAVPTDLAIQTIVKYSPIVEIGAGTGYWAQLLQLKGAKISAFDSIPTTITGEQNEYHANVPPYHEVTKAGVSAVRKYPTASLFLCFPPPEDTMALDALRLYTGQHVIHVGEWEGFTGSLEFEIMLMQSFELVERVELPNWQDTCYDLTVWKRKLTSSSSSKAGASAMPNLKSKMELGSISAESSSTSMSSQEKHSNLTTRQCFGCGKMASVLRRCRCCRVISFCSKSCASNASRQHTSIHAIQGTFTKDLETTLDYNQKKHYRLLRTKQV